MPVLVAEHVAQRTGDGGIRRALVDEVARFIRLEVDVARDDVAVLVDERGQTVAVQALEVHGEERTVRVALLGEARAGDEVDDAVARVEVGHLSISVRVDQVGAPLEVLGHDVARGEGELLAVRLHRGHVGKLHDGAAHTRGALGADEVIVVASVPVELEVDAVVQEAQVYADVQLVLLLVGQCGVGQAGDVEARLLVVGIGAVGVVGLNDDHRVGHGGLVARQRVRGFQCSVGQHVLESLLKPGLLVGVPCCRDVPCGQPAGRAGAAEAVGALVAHGAVDGVAAFIAVGSGAEERGLAAVAVAHRVVDGVLLAGLLEVLVVVGAEPALIKVHAHLVVVAAGTVDVVHLHAAVGVHDVGVVEHVVVAGRGAEVPRIHLVNRLAHEAALVEHRLRQRVDYVGVGVEPGVGVAHRGVVHHAEGHGLVTILFDELLLRGGGVLVGSDGAQLDGAHGLVLQLGLELGVEHVELHVVVGQFVVDVEGSIVAHVELVGIERTRAVDGIRIGVDIEVTSHGASDRVDTLVRRAGSLLLAVGRVADEVQRYALVQVVVGVDVGRVAAHLTALSPARVVHHRERGIVLGLVRTCRHRHGVVVRD